VAHPDLITWTRHEATLKLTGEGLRGSEHGPPPGVRVVALDGLGPGYVGAIAQWADQPGKGGSSTSYSQGPSSAATS